ARQARRSEPSLAAHARPSPRRDQRLARHHGLGLLVHAVARTSTARTDALLLLLRPRLLLLGPRTRRDARAPGIGPRPGFSGFRPTVRFVTRTVVHFVDSDAFGGSEQSLLHLL